MNLRQWIGESSSDNCQNSQKCSGTGEEIHAGKHRSAPKL